MSDRLGLVALLVALGVGWGVTQPLAKIAVSDGAGALGLVFWQLVIGAVLLGALTLARGRPLRWGLSRMRVWLTIALIGTVLPNAASYSAAAHLPSGLLSIVLSLVPMFAYVIALGLTLERFRLNRLGGLLLGLAGVGVLIVPPALGTGGAIPPGSLGWLAVAMIAPFFYGWEGNAVALWGTAGMDAVQVLAGASLVGAVLAAPLALATGQWVPPAALLSGPGAALAASGTIHAVVYTTYIWLVGRAGAVFAVQVSYIVTGAGVTWAMLLLGERYSGGVWLALALIFAGLALVQPKPALNTASN